MIARCCYLFVAISIIAVFVFTCFFQVVSESTCEGIFIFYFFISFFFSFSYPFFFFFSFFSFLLMVFLL